MNNNILALLFLCMLEGRKKQRICFKYGCRMIHNIKDHSNLSRITVIQLRVGNYFKFSNTVYHMIMMVNLNGMRDTRVLSN